jgi:DNA-binding Lrp family transcriptional regulator
MKQEMETKYFDDRSSPAFSFIICEPGKEILVIEKLRTLKTVKEIHRIHGKYDLIVKLENMTESELRGLIHDEIQDMTVVKSVMNPTSICAGHKYK